MSNGERVLSICGTFWDQNHNRLSAKNSKKCPVGRGGLEHLWPFGFKIPHKSRESARYYRHILRRRKIEFPGKKEKGKGRGKWGMGFAGTIVLENLWHLLEGGRVGKVICRGKGSWAFMAPFGVKSLVPTDSLPKNSKNSSILYMHIATKIDFLGEGVKLETLYLAPVIKITVDYRPNKSKKWLIL